MATKTKLGKILEAYRIINDITAIEFAKILGLSRVRLSQIENGKALIAWGRYNFLNKVSKLNNLTLSEKAEIDSLINFASELDKVIKAIKNKVFYSDIEARKALLKELNRLSKGF